MLRPKFRIRKVFHQTSSDLFSPVSSLKTVEPFLTITSKKNLLSTWSFAFEVVCRFLSRPSSMWACCTEKWWLRPHNVPLRLRVLLRMWIEV